MKQQIHPKFHLDAQVSCRSCGTTFTTGSTMQNIMVEVCSSCHPFYTGEQRFMDTQGRVQRYEEAKKKAAEWEKKVVNKKQGKDKSDKKVKSLKELLSEMG